MKKPPFAGLDPDCILDAVEAAGHRCDGRLLALNSYENRVWQVGREDAAPLVAKFYRAGRWSDAQILEEHAYSTALAEAELPVVAPLVVAGGSTLCHHRGFRYALYPRQGGHWPPLDDPETLYRLGRLLGRIHSIGARTRFAARPTLTIERCGHEPRAAVLAGPWLPDYLRTAYESVSRDLLAAIEAAFTGVHYRAIRLHGDCHPGNILWTPVDVPAVAGPGGAADAFVHQGAADIVGPAIEAGGDPVRPQLDPAGLYRGDLRMQRQPRHSVHQPHFAEGRPAPRDPAASERDGLPGARAPRRDRGPCFLANA